MHSLLNRHKALLLGQVFGTDPMPVEGQFHHLCFETVLKTDVIIRPFPVGEVVELVL